MKRIQQEWNNQKSQDAREEGIDHEPAKSLHGFNIGRLGRNELSDRFFEHALVGVHVGFGGGWAHQSHVVERGEQDASVSQVKVKEIF